VQNVAPTIARLVCPAVGPAGRPVELSAVAADPGQDALTYSWDFGDGAPVLEGIGLSQLSHSYAAAGTYTVTLTVADGDGGQAVAAADIRVVAGQPLAVEQVVVNAGAAQRSNLERLTVHFNQAARLQELIDSGEIVHAVALAGPLPVRLTADRFRYSHADRTLEIDLTVDGFGGSSRSMLADGHYELLLDAADVLCPLSAPLLDADGEPDGVHRFGFYQMACDFDGDAAVGMPDRDLFLPFYRSAAGDGRYQAAFDLNGDGRIDGVDYYELRRRIIASP
jgi:hypothetical protein